MENSVPAPRKRKKPNKHVVKTLQRYQRAYRALMAENAYYRIKEAALFETVAAAEHSLHFVGTVLAWQQSADGNSNGLENVVVEALIADLRAHELMSGLDGGRGPQDLTTVERSLHAAVTPARIAEVRCMNLQQLADHLMHMTQRISGLLSSSTGTAAPSEQLQQAVDEYNQFCMLLHIAHDTACLQLCLLKLDTKQEQQAPAAMWEGVARVLELLPRQAERLAAAWDVFFAKRAPLVQRLQDLASKVHELLQPLGPEQPAPSSSAASASIASTFLHQPPPLNGHISGAVSSSLDEGVLEQQLSSLTVQQLSSASLDGCLPDVARRSCSTASSGSRASAQSEERVDSYPGALDLEQTDSLHEHLQEMMVLTRQLRELGRNMVFLFLNTTNCQQQAIAITHSWPWFCQPTMVCEHVARLLKDFNTCAAKPGPQTAT